jgi:hypothetical protein
MRGSASLYLQDRVDFPDKLHPDVDRAFGYSATELCGLLVFVVCFSGIVAYLEVIRYVIAFAARLRVCCSLV